MNPSVIILDEPTSELDPLGREEIYTTIQELQRAKDVTVVAVEHSSQEIIERADEIVVLGDKKVVWQGKPSDFFRDLNLVNNYGVKPLPVSSVGWAFYKKGYIKKDEIPITVDEAHTCIRKLLSGRKICNKTENATIKEQNTTPLIQVENVNFKYESSTEALRGVNLNIYKGDFIALIGQNGAGKTTLARHFNSIFKPTSGTIKVCGKDTAKEDPQTLSPHVGYVFQNPDHQIFCTTVYKEMAYGLKNSRIDPEEINKRINEIAELLDLTELLAEHPFSLGKGERQRIAVASILVLKPEILVIDEPTTGQDWTGVQNMMTLIDTLHKNGTTIIIITHDMDIVARYASRVVVLGSGEVKLDGSTHEVFTHTETLSEAFINRPQIAELSERLQDCGLSQMVMTEEEMSRLVINAVEGG